MFLQYYGLQDQPFGVTPDPRFLYFSATHREALASLFYGIESGCGFLTLIAPPGMGKTTLLFHLLEKLRGSAQTVFLFQTQCSSREFFRYLLTDLGGDANEQNLAGMHEALNAVLLRNARVGRRVVLVIDEAQNLADSVLETVRLLSDFETPEAKLLQIVLSGQPQLADKLSHPALMQLRQRISIVSRLHPLTRVETMVYLEYRLCKAGYSGPPLFGYDAIELIVAHSGGVPRNINNICFNALTLGYAKRQRQIDASIVIEVLADMDFEGLGHHPMASGLMVPDSLTSFDGMSPTDEGTYQEFHDAVRAAWGNGIEVKTHEDILEGNPALIQSGNGIHPLESISNTSVGSETLSESPVEMNYESDQETTVHFDSASTPPAVSHVPPRKRIREARQEKARRRAGEGSSPIAPSEVELFHPTLSPPEVGALQGENSQDPGTSASEPNGPATSTPAADEKPGNDTSKPNLYLSTSGTVALPNSLTAGAEVLSGSIGRWARAMSRLLQHAHKKMADAGNRGPSTGGRTMIIVVFALIVGGALLVGRVNKTVQPGRDLATATSAPDTVERVKPPSTIEPIKISHDARKGVTKRPNRAPGNDSTVITLESGQTLSEISLRYLGRFDNKVAQQIQTLNPEIKNPNLIILAGTQVRLPGPPGLSEGSASFPGGVSSTEEHSR